MHNPGFARELSLGKCWTGDSSDVGSTKRRLLHELAEKSGGIDRLGKTASAWDLPVSTTIGDELAAIYDQGLIPYF